MVTIEQNIVIIQQDIVSIQQDIVNIQKDITSVWQDIYVQFIIYSLHKSKISVHIFKKKYVYVL